MADGVALMHTRFSCFYTSFLPFLFFREIYSLISRLLYPHLCCKYFAILTSENVIRNLVYFAGTHNAKTFIIHSRLKKTIRWVILGKMVLSRSISIFPRCYNYDMSVRNDICSLMFRAKLSILSIAIADTSNFATISLFSAPKYQRLWQCLNCNSHIKHT